MKDNTASGLHIDDSVVARWWSRALTSSEVLAVAEHVGHCEPCRSRLTISHGVDDTASAIAQQLSLDDEGNRSAHLEADQIGRLVEGRLGDIEVELAQAHIEQCPLCRAKVEDLARFAASLRRPGAWRAMTAAGLAAAVLVVFGLVFRSHSWPASSTPPTVPRATRSVAALQLRDGPLTVDASGVIHGIDPAWQPLVAEAMTTPDLPAPPSLLRLQPSAERQRGESKSPPAIVRLVAPLSRVHLADRPIFRWIGPPGDTYRVEVFDGRFREVARSEPLHVQSWQPARPLPRGEELTWVLAVGSARESVYPTPPQPPAAFQLASEQEVQRIAVARATGSHLIAGMALWQTGLVTEAADEFARLAKQNPRSASARRLASSSAREAARFHLDDADR